MKYLLSSFLIFTIFACFSQTMDEYISNAKSDYSNENYEGARFNLQNALLEIDKIIAKEILASLPSQLGGMKSDPANDATTGTGSFLGLYVNRTYGNPDGENATVTIASNSPMYAMVNTFLSNPLLSGMAGMSSGQKVVRIGGYKGMLQSSDDGEFNIMVPFGDSLMTLDTNIKDESKVTSMANALPLSSIAEVVK